MKYTPRFLLSSVLLLALMASELTVNTAAAEDWVDTQGNTISGEPAGLIGPLALFKSGRARGRRLPLQYLKAEDAWRFEQGLRALPARADVWAEGNSLITEELRDIVQLIEGNKLVDYDMTGQKEPELLLVFFLRAGSDERILMESAIEYYQPLKARYGSDFEVLFVGVGHSLIDHINFSVTVGMPWLITNRNRQSQLDEIAMFAPNPAPGLLLMSRHGVPIKSESGIRSSDVDKIFVELEGLLKAMAPTNRATLAAKAQFHNNARLQEFASSEGAPKLLASPFLPSQLAKLGITGFELEADVDATGVISNVTVHPGPGIADKFLKAVGSAFTKAPALPAVKNGQFVAGKLTYTYPEE